MFWGAAMPFDDLALQRGPECMPHPARRAADVEPESVADLLSLRSGHSHRFGGYCSAHPSEAEPLRESLTGFNRGRPMATGAVGQFLIASPYNSSGVGGCSVSI